MDKPMEIGNPQPLKIAGIGCYVPKRVVTNREIEAGGGLDPGWCAAHLGVEERRWVETETPSFMGAEAAREAVEMANLELEDIDLVISASGTAIYEQGLPDGGPLVQKQLGLEQSGIPGFTLQNNDMSFMLALEVGAALMAANLFENILVVSSEILSLNLDLTNPYVYGLFGDGAAAALLMPTPADEASGIHTVRFETYGAQATHYQSRFGLSLSRKKDVKPEDFTLQMNQEVFMEKGSHYTHRLLQKMMENQKIKLDDMEIVIPQQLGKLYSESLAQRGIIPGEKIIEIHRRYGYCGAASIPMALYEAVKNGRLTRGDRFLMVGVGAGMSVGGMTLTY